MRPSFSHLHRRLQYRRPQKTPSLQQLQSQLFSLPQASPSSSDQSTAVPCPPSTVSDQLRTGKLSPYPDDARREYEAKLAAQLEAFVRERAPAVPHVPPPLASKQRVPQDARRLPEAIIPAAPEHKLKAAEKKAAKRRAAAKEEALYKKVLLNEQEWLDEIADEKSDLHQMFHEKARIAILKCREPPDAEDYLEQPKVLSRTTTPGQVTVTRFEVNKKAQEGIRWYNHRFTEIEHAHFRRATTLIALAKRAEPGTFNQTLLRWIEEMAQHTILLRMLSSEAWDVLLAQERKTIPTEYSVRIGRLMIAKKIAMTEEQELDFLGALFWNGERHDAFQEWALLALRTNPPPSAKAWNLGVRMYALNNEPDKAVQIYQIMKSMIGRPDPKSLIPIVMSYNHAYKHFQAWNTFKDFMRAAKLRPKDVTRTHFEDLALSFMDAKTPDRSIQVYKIMTDFGHEVPDYSQEASKFYHSILEDAEQLHSFSIEMAKELKDLVNKKYFYASWLTNLVRLGRTDLAWAVKDFMETQGLSPDAQHIFAIVEGFLADKNWKAVDMVVKTLAEQRLKNLESRQIAIDRKAVPKAEQQAEAMGGAHEGMNNSQSTFSPQDGNGASVSSVESINAQHQVAPQPTNIDDTKFDIKKTRLSRPAELNIQILSRVIQAALRTKNMDRVGQYAQLLGSCQIAPNAYLLNHFLYAFYKLSDMQRMNDVYGSLVHGQGVTPNAHSWEVMWKAMFHRYYQKRRRTDLFISPRKLFRDMVTYIPPHDPVNPDASIWRQEEPSGHKLWLLALRGFILARDWMGLAIALNVGLRRWHIAIEQDIYKEVITGGYVFGKLGGNGEYIRVDLSDQKVERSVHKLMVIHEKLLAEKKLRQQQDQLPQTERLKPRPELTEREWAAYEVEWNNIRMDWMRSTPLEQAELALELVTKLVVAEIGEMTMAQLQLLREARLGMGVPEVPLKALLPAESKL